MVLINSLTSTFSIDNLVNNYWQVVDSVFSTLLAPKVINTINRLIVASL